MYFPNFSLYVVFHSYFSLSCSLSSLLIIIVILCNWWLSTNWYFIIAKNQLNFKNLPSKLYLSLPKFHQQCSFEVSALLLKHSKMTNSSISSLCLLFFSTNLPSKTFFHQIYFFSVFLNVSILIFPLKILCCIYIVLISEVHSEPCQHLKWSFMWK